MKNTSKSSEMSVCEKPDDFELYKNGIKKIAESYKGQLYSFKTFIGNHVINIEKGDCAYYHSDDNETCYIQSGPATIDSKVIATVIRGYSPPSRSSEIGTETFLPYINGCSTRQIFTPDRIGDPTLQLLHMPPHSSEQEHHIHSTARVVYVLKGTGTSIIGMDKKVKRVPLTPGNILILHPMCPHHFETNDESLLVMPLHIFSSPPNGLEFNHPMFNGTHRIG